MIAKLVNEFSTRARQRRAGIFRSIFELGAETRILDLGSESGLNIFTVLRGTAVKPENVYIADIEPTLIEKGQRDFGFVPVLIGETEKLPFKDGFFDIVFCSSVIEHVTVPKDLVWASKSGFKFRREALVRQTEFAQEVQRLGRQFFVQTPYRFFPIESHTWFPLLSFVPRRTLIPILRILNKFWIKKTKPDWNLLTKKELAGMFKDSRIVCERSFGMIKSIMAIKSNILIYVPSGE